MITTLKKTDVFTSFKILAFATMFDVLTTLCGWFLGIPEYNPAGFKGVFIGNGIIIALCFLIVRFKIKIIFERFVTKLNIGVSIFRIFCGVVNLVIISMVLLGGN